jgi:aminopeptidase N
MMMRKIVHLKYIQSILFFTSACCGLSLAHAAGSDQAQGFDVLHYRADIQPDIASKTLSGKQTIQLRINRAGLDKISFDADGLSILDVFYNGKKVNFSTAIKKLHIHLPKPAEAGANDSIDILYSAKPKFGLQFYPEREELYTIYSTSQWLVVIDSPDERASLDLSIRLPKAFKSVGNGKLRSIAVFDKQTDIHRWQLDADMPSYVYGFAASKYNEMAERRNGIKLRYLSKDHKPEQLKQIFSDTSDMLQFFSKRTGIPYRSDYTQALVADTIGQEMAGFALMSEEYGAEILRDPTKKGLMAHEVAHQWWGNAVTCKDWNHFWLNEGFATFMAAAYLEYRFGQDVYRVQVERWQTRVEKLRVDGKDHGLVYEQWSKPSGDDRAVVYQKGAFVLHQLRLELGEKVFWDSIKYYTQQYYGKSVTTEEFKHAIEKASGRDLSIFFTSWIDAPNADITRQPVAIDEK